MSCDARPYVNFHYAQDGVLGCLAGEKSTGFFTRQRFNVELEWPEIFFLESLHNQFLCWDPSFLQFFRSQFLGWDTLSLLSFSNQLLGSQT